MATRPVHDEGSHLAQALAHVRVERPFVLAIPRGAMLVADAVARALDAPLDVVIAGKVLTREGIAVAALAEGGALVVDDAAVASLGLTGDELERLIDRERARQDAMLERIRGTWPLPTLAGRTVVLIDDAVISGLTMRAAMTSLRGRGVRRIVVAAPLGAREDGALRAAGAGEVVYLTTLSRPLAKRVHDDDRAKPCPPLGDEEIHQMVDRELHDLGFDPFGGLAIDGI